MNTDGCFKINHPKWSRLDQEAHGRKILQLSKNAIRPKQVSQKFVKRLLKLSFGRDTTHCRHSPKPRQRTIRKISSLIEYGRARFITYIVTHHNLAKQQKVKIPPTNHPILSKQISNIHLFPD